MDGKWDYFRFFFLNLDLFYYGKMNDEDEILFLYIFLNCIVLMLRGNIGYCIVRCIYKKCMFCCVDFMKFIVNKYNIDKNWFFDLGI